MCIGRMNFGVFVRNLADLLVDLVAANGRLERTFETMVLKVHVHCRFGKQVSQIFFPSILGPSNDCKWVFNEASLILANSEHAPFFQFILNGVSFHSLPTSSHPLFSSTGTPTCPF